MPRRRRVGQNMCGRRGEVEGAGLDSGVKGVWRVGGGVRDVDVRRGRGGVGEWVGRGGEGVGMEVGRVDEDEELCSCRVDVGGEVGEDRL